MRQDVALVLMDMGYVAEQDFSAYQDGTNAANVIWRSQQQMPSEATINAYVLPTAQQRLYNLAKALLTADDPISKKEKAVLLVILDEFNSHANKINAIMTAIDGAATFAAMKTAIAAIADYPQRTASQIKTSVAGKIDGGLADG